MVTKHKQARGTDKASCNGCGCSKYSKRERFLIHTLLLTTFIAAVYWCCLTLHDYNRYELYPYYGMEQPIVYKLDKRTGKVTVYNALWEFDTDKFSEMEPTADKHWSFPSRMAQQQDLLYAIPEQH